MFGDRFLTREMHSPKPLTSPSNEREAWNNYSPLYFPPTPVKKTMPKIVEDGGDDDGDDCGGGDTVLGDAVKRLEAELEETKKELTLLKERETETEVAVASLNAELHMNMSKMAKAEAEAAAAAALKVSAALETDLYTTRSPSVARGLRNGEREHEEEGYLSLKERRKERTIKMKKMKPIIPLLGDLFSSTRKKRPSYPLYLTPHAYF